MPSETFYMRFMWGPRAEDLDMCATRAYQLLSRLSSVDPIFRRWRTVRESEKYVKTRGLEQLRNWLMLGVNRTDIGKNVMPELGYSISLLAGEENTPLALRICCGITSRWVSNVISLDFSYGAADAERLLQVSILKEVALSVVTCWDPDHGVITSHQVGELFGDQFDTQAGWLTYVSDRCYGALALPGSLEVAPTGSGRLIVATPDRPFSADKQHVKVVKKLSASLKKAILRA